MGLDELRRIAEGVTFKGASNVSALAASFVTSIFLTRHFGRESYGLLILTYSVTSFLLNFSDFGVKRTLQRYIPRYLSMGEQEKAGAMMQSALLLQVAGILMVTGLLFMLRSTIAVQVFGKPALYPLLLTGVFYLGSFALFDFCLQFYQSLQRWPMEGALNFLHPLLYLLLLLGIVYGVYDGVAAALIANGMAGLTVVAVGALLLPPEVRCLLLRRPRWEWLLTQTRVTLSFGGPLVFSAFVFVVSGWLDKALLGKYRPLDEVTDYYIAASFIAGMMLLFKTLNVVLSPYVAEISTGEEGLIRARFHTVFRWVLQAALLSGIAMYVIAEPLILFLYGGSFGPAVMAFRLLLAVYVARAVTTATGLFAVNAYGLVKRHALLTAVLITVNILLNIVLIPGHGLFGAAAAAIGAYVAYHGAFLIIMPEVRRLIPVATVVRTAVAVAGTTAVAILLARAGVTHPVLTGSALLGTYLTMLGLSGEVRKGDVETARHLMGSVLAMVRRLVRVCAAG
ncbi:MAG: oligosaccharide flippase family protein [Deltaproteobacteria bacterium]|nr:oligosaccharide flippase family protein [Deltaproteobacteria bacterium]